MTDKTELQDTLYRVRNLLESGHSEAALTCLNDVLTAIAADRAKRAQVVSLTDQQIIDAFTVQGYWLGVNQDEIARVIAAARSLLADASLHLANAPQVPEGFVLVPNWPTEEMMRAWECAPYNENADDEFRGAYAAMLSAAPQPEQKG